MGALYATRALDKGDNTSAYKSLSVLHCSFVTGEQRKSCAVTELKSPKHDSKTRFTASVKIVDCVHLCALCKACFHNVPPQRQTSLTGENCLLCGHLQLQEKGKSWSKMWGAVTKAEPLVLYLQSSGQVGDQHAHTQYTQSGICVSHLWTWFGSHAQNAHTPKEALSVAHAAPVSLSHDLIGKEQAYTKRLWICFEPDAHTLPAQRMTTPLIISKCLSIRSALYLFCSQLSSFTTYRLHEMWRICWSRTSGAAAPPQRAPSWRSRPLDAQSGFLVISAVHVAVNLTRGLHDCSK